ncbi:MAG: Gfo/Idh/MocA family oxidoreductase [Planctomycetes bacterium]|nr:Gfo/Idh/MocA family oxidoreductase [Planctomycetota bacterium]
MRAMTRRAFLKTAAAAAPYVVTSAALGAAGRPPPSRRAAIAHVGVGGQGTGLLRGFLSLPHAQSVAVCDPISDRRYNRAEMVNKHYADQAAAGTFRGCAACNDFRDVLAREDIDAVVIATPDHWHVPLALEAVRAGKDVYVEKPLGISVAHDKALREAVHRYGAVFQYGTQQRCFNTHCGFACELVRNGYLGQLKAVHVVAPDGATGGDPAPQPVPDGLDYDMWLGPAPVTPYAHDRVMGIGRWHIYDYAIGFIAGWGAHPLDIAHWGYPHVPVEYEGTGFIPSEGLFDTVVHWDVRGGYAGGAEFTLKPGGDKTTFVGTEGWVAPSRGGIAAEPASLLKVKIKPGEVHLLQDNHHYRNFVDAVLARRTPASDIDSAVQSDIMSHLGDIAIRTGRLIRWDPARETIIGDEEAARMLTRPMRAPWRL